MRLLLAEDDAMIGAAVRDRLRAVLRRRAGSASSVIEHGRLSLDLASHELRRDGVPVPVSPREFALLHALSATEGLSTHATTRCWTRCAAT